MWPARLRSMVAGLNGCGMWLDPVVAGSLCWCVLAVSQLHMRLVVKKSQIARNPLSLCKGLLQQ